MNLKPEQIRTEIPDWAELLQPDGLLRKAGCTRGELFSLVLRELADNSLDEGAAAALSRKGATWIVTDDGPGIDPPDVPKLFSVNRPLSSSKRKRLPTRGMLGNGLRVVVGAAVIGNGELMVETRGHCVRLSIDSSTGITTVTSDQPSEVKIGVTVHITLPGSTEVDGRLAVRAIVLASLGRSYSGPSSPWWYGTEDMRLLLRHVTPESTPVGKFCADLGLDLDDERKARSLSVADAKDLLARLREKYPPIQPNDLGSIGREMMVGAAGYAIKRGTRRLADDVRIPYIVEACARCERSEMKSGGDVTVDLVINRTPSLTRLFAQYSKGDGIGLGGVRA
jgi:hypothetical protein